MRVIGKMEFLMERDSRLLQMVTLITVLFQTV